MKDLSVALEHIERAADAGSNIIVFPECYPGPATGPMNWSSMDSLCSKAEKRSVYVITGMLEDRGDVCLRHLGALTQVT